MSTKRLLFIKEFTQEYGPSRAKVYLMLNSGEIAGKKHGRSTYIASEEAERWLNSLPAYRSSSTASSDQCEAN